MTVFDAHTHIVAADQRRYPRKVYPNPEWVKWLKDMPADAERLMGLMDAAGVQRAALVQPYAVYEYDNSYIADSASRHADRFVGVCIVDMDKPDAAERLAAWAKRGVRGIRLFTITQPEAAWLDDPRTYPVWERAGALGAPVCVQVPFHQVPRAARVVERFPQVTVVLENLAGAPLSEGPPYTAAAPLFELSRFANLYVKFSTPNLYAAASGRSTPREFFSRLVDRFGARRLLWGTNFPNTYDRPYPQLVAHAREALAFLPEEEQRRLFGETATRLWPLKP